MKSTLSTVYLLAFTMGVVSSSELKGYKSSSFECANYTVTVSCIKDIIQFASNSNPIKHHKASIMPNSNDVVFVATNETYNACTEFTKEITSIGNCKTCIPLYFDKNNPNDCVDELPPDHGDTM